MAQKVQTLFIDDLDGSAAEGTVRFGLDGTEYEIDLNAERTHVQEGTLARSLLSVAIEEADPDARHVVAVLDGIPGAYERALQSLERARAGETIALDEL